MAVAFSNSFPSIFQSTWMSFLPITTSMGSLTLPTCSESLYIHNSLLNGKLAGVSKLRSNCFMPSGRDASKTHGFISQKFGDSVVIRFDKDFCVRQMLNLVEDLATANSPTRSSRCSS